MTDRQNPYAGDHCSDQEHTLHRRKFLQGMGAGVGASMFSWSGLLTPSVFAEIAKKQQKNCILLWLCGAPSQFETWDPKPGRITSGPFGSIPTKIPGVHFSELMPQCATIADKLAVIRSMKTEPTEHFQAIDRLTRGDAPRPPFVRPALGSVLGQQLGQLDSPIPNFILLDPCPEGNEFKSFKAGNWAGWLGAEYGPVRLGGDYKIPDVHKLPDITTQDHEEREAFRSFLTRKFENERQSAAASSQNAAFQRVKGLMSCADLFDLEKLPTKDRERYGQGTFGQHTLLARNLVENGAPFVMVANGMPWDCHVFQHEIYQMLVPDLDNIIYQLITDLEDRGMLDNTLVVMMGEFGRTPWLNASRGRDHYPNAWSMALAGSGIQPGAVVGATDKDGIEVAEDPFDERNLFATLFTALGIDPNTEYDLPGLPTFHRVEKEAKPIHQVLI
ncbi:DUF1501 domain-containing protein [Verrucomicrobia bacterium]|nr:DUF1501 domain-containing protein [Verrucomicrobiota bacterium]MDB4619440.1 DUF1501 domain-containing protein [bacterium]MDC0264065.1 DUF1501 domain-containing protein [Verrucomicrobiota bacterium]MDC0295969.1 DUF1501 domain-containing protein [bacterium]